MIFCRLIAAEAAIAASVCFASLCPAGEADGTLDIYFIDVEGGAATLLVTPAGESVLIDSGYPDNHGRDRDRIIAVARDVAGLKQIDHAVVSHWHRDHYGNHAALESALGIVTFWDRGIPDSLQEDPEFHDRIGQYRAASQNESRKLSAGDVHRMASATTPLSVEVLTSGRDVIANKGLPNPFADRHVPADPDPSDNAASLSLLFRFGEFRFLCCGDLTWNIEGKLMTPSNPVGTVDLFMVTHHGLPTSNNPALVLAVDPTVTVMCNGPVKGCADRTLKTLREIGSLKAMYQLHEGLQADRSLQAPREHIANFGSTEDCRGQWILARVAADGGSYTLQIGPNGEARRYAVRDHAVIDR